LGKPMITQSKGDGGILEENSSQNVAISPFLRAEAMVGTKHGRKEKIATFCKDDRLIALTLLIC
jgi:hypothetical protein